MDYQPIKQGVTGLISSIESAPSIECRPKEFDISLLIETALVVVIAVLAVKMLDLNSGLMVSWLTIPGILIVAALIPTLVRRRKFSQFGFNIQHMRDSFVVLGRICVVFLPLAFCGLWLIKSFGIELPLRPVLPQGQNWIYWLFYQFMYISLAEEVFFRGYILSNTLSLTNSMINRMPRLQQWISIVLSAVCFAVAHIIIQGQIISVLTFFPGLVLGWLFIRTNSLLAPILFHGLANVCYLVITAMLT